MPLTHKRLADWVEALKVYQQRRVLTLLFFGFSSGLPLLLVWGTLSVWLREAGIERSTIGFISWVALVYAFKWLWSPLVDRLPLPVLTRSFGRRRAWLLASQFSLICGLIGMALTDPSQNLNQMVWLALLVAFASATQDISIDAFRIESGSPKIQAAMASTYMVGYRLAMICAGAGVLWIASWVDPDEQVYHHASWIAGYGVMAALMLIGFITTLLVAEPMVQQESATQASEQQGDQWLAQRAGLHGRTLRLASWIWRSVISPFVDFFRRYGWHALLLLALIACYRISDIVLGIIANVFYIDMGFSKAEIANVTKVFGVIMTLLGSILGGLLVRLYGVMPILFLGALLSAGTNLLFAVLANIGHDLFMLIWVVMADNLSGGLAVAAFVAYLSGLTNVSYSATQYALFSSVMLLLPKFVGGFSGVMVDQLSYPGFFSLTALIGLPVLILVGLAWRYAPVTSVPDTNDQDAVNA